MTDRHDQSEITALSTAECHRMLASRSIGRVGVIVDGFPLIIPVNYALDGDAVIIRTEPGSVVAHADEANVAFEVDHFDDDNHSGWSVLVRGRGQAVRLEDDAEMIRRTKATGVSPWAPGEHRLWIRITPTEISGRRIIPGPDLEWRLGTAAYM